MKVINHKWIKKVGERNNIKICVRCGILRDTSTSYTFYVGKKGNTIWVRPNCDNF